MVDPAKLLELVKCSIEELMVEQVGVDVTAILDDLQREITLIVEVLTMHNFVIL